MFDHGKERPSLFSRKRKCFSSRQGTNPSLWEWKQVVMIPPESSSQASWRGIHLDGRGQSRAFRKKEKGKRNSLRGKHRGTTEGGGSRRVFCILREKTRIPGRRESDCPKRTMTSSLEEKKKKETQVRSRRQGKFRTKREKIWLYYGEKKRAGPFQPGRERC